MQLAPEEPEAGPWRAEPLKTVIDTLIKPGPGRGVARRPAVLAVDGRSNNGKTTLAARIREAMPGSAVVHTDDIAWWHSRFGWADLLIDGILVPVHRGQAVSYRPPRWTEHGRDGAIEVPIGCPLLIIEGDGAGRREAANLGTCRRHRLRHPGDPLRRRYRNRRRVAVAPSQLTVALPRSGHHTRAERDRTGGLLARRGLLEAQCARDLNSGTVLIAGWPGSSGCRGRWSASGGPGSCRAALTGDPRPITRLQDDSVAPGEGPREVPRSPSHPGSQARQVTSQVASCRCTAGWPAPSPRLPGTCPAAPDSPGTRYRSASQRRTATPRGG